MSATNLLCQAGTKKTGLGGYSLPDPVMPLQAQSPIDFIIDRLRHDPAGLGKIAALGPQTNIATSLIRAPDIVTRAEEIIIMGGAYFEVGNTRPTTAA